MLTESGTSLPGNLAPALADVKENESAIYRDGCHMGYTSARTPLCVYGDRTSDDVVVLFGDSHAAQWFPALDQVARERGWQLVSLTKASCKVAAVTIVKEGEPYASCEAWRDNALEMIAELRPSLVITSSSDAGDPVDAMADPLAGWTAGYEDTFRRLADTGARVSVLLDTPWPREDAVECAALHPLELDRCTSEVPETIRDRTRREATRAAAETTGVSVIDPLPWLCTGAGDCPVVVGDTFVYRDDNHVSEAYAEALAPVLGEQLDGVLGREP
ncbi:SGNH hydrolase domain-containing protein [Streptomyces specialis]|uniref:SGNH hydrolase domain-containing protein n=1 Tax=Streptomyces specialis TaxID=498367 RepID=UPI00131E86C5|nr:SGNH hydrolase domain-containing protein [Streptomyces specialis]